MGVDGELRSMWVWWMVAEAEGGVWGCVDECELKGG